MIVSAFVGGGEYVMRTFLSSSFLSERCFYLCAVSSRLSAISASFSCFFLRPFPVVVVVVIFRLDVDVEAFVLVHDAVDVGRLWV